ncbi:MAG: PAS domain S-box protein [Cyanobacteria bacterium P01_H01_bin.121]
MTTWETLQQETDLPLVLTDQQGLIMAINAAFTQVLGWQAAEIIGQSITVIIPTGYHDAHHLGFSRFLATQQSVILDHPLQLKGIQKDGTEIDLEHWIRAEKRHNQWQFMATLRPLSDIRPLSDNRGEQPLED